MSIKPINNELQSFSISQLEKRDNENYVLYGDLTISIPVEFGGRAKDSWGNIRAGFTPKVKINKKRL